MQVAEVELETREIAFSSIKADIAFQPRERFDDDAIERYAEAFRENNDCFSREPMVVFPREDGSHSILDGFHRYWAISKVEGDSSEGAEGARTIEVRVFRGTEAQAKEHAIRSNFGNRALPMTRGDRFKAIGMLLALPEWENRSAREIARVLGVSHPTVGKVKEELGKVTESVIVKRRGREYEQNSSGKNYQIKKEADTDPHLPVQVGQVEREAAFAPVASLEPARPTEADEPPTDSPPASQMESLISQLAEYSAANTALSQANSQLTRANDELRGVRKDLVEILLLPVGEVLPKLEGYRQKYDTPQPEIPQSAQEERQVEPEPKPEPSQPEVTPEPSKSGSKHPEAGGLTLAAICKHHGLSRQNLHRGAKNHGQSLPEYLRHRTGIGWIQRGKLWFPTGAELESQGE